MATLTPYEEKRRLLYLEEELEKMARQLDEIAKEIGLTIWVQASEEYEPEIKVFRAVEFDGARKFAMTEAVVMNPGDLIGLIARARTKEYTPTD